MEGAERDFPLIRLVFRAIPEEGMGWRTCFLTYLSPRGSPFLSLSLNQVTFLISHPPNCHWREGLYRKRGLVEVKGNDRENPPVMVRFGVRTGF